MLSCWIHAFRGWIAIFDLHSLSISFVLTCINSGKFNRRVIQANNCHNYHQFMKFFFK